MLGAILRLVLISAATLFFSFMAITAIRWAGLRQNFAPPAHAWYTLPDWQLTKVDSQQLCSGNKQLEVDGIAWLRVFYRDGVWTLGPSCETKGTAIKDALERTKEKNWLIEIESVDTQPLDALIEQLSALDKEKNFGIYSESQRVARYLRKKSPQWLYAADAASLVRLHMFSSLWLEPILEFWPDFIIQYPDDKATRLTAREAAEMERRKKRVILLPNGRP